MIGLEFRFPGGRYHATPWDAHVNEGVVEWPPSPWRILRALLAVWHRKRSEVVSRDVIERLVTKLASTPPSYSLPLVQPGHTRHYMPSFKGNTTKVFDAFYQIGERERLSVIWDVEIDEEERCALRLLAESISYLGRAESWVEAEIIESEREANAVPVKEGCTTRVLAPIPSDDFDTWRAAMVDEQSTRKLAEKKRKATDRGKPIDKIKLNKKEAQAIENGLAANLVEALETDTATFRKQGWSCAPGARWVDYKVDPPSSSRARSQPRWVGKEPQVARFAVASQAPLRLTKAVTFADRVRRALLSYCGDSVLAGRKDGHPNEGHDHVYVLPEANRRDGRISHVTLFCERGLDEDALGAVNSLRTIGRRKKSNDIQFVLLGVGDPEEFSGLDVFADQCALFEKSKVWVSRTPFVPTRHPKKFSDGRPKIDETGLQIGSVEHDLRRLLSCMSKERNVPEPVEVTPTEGTKLGSRPANWLEFQTIRFGGKGKRASNRGFGLRIRFEQEVRGPIALGYGAHFGLGCFLPSGVFDE